MIRQGRNNNKSVRLSHCLSALLLATVATAGVADLRVGFLGGFTGPVESVAPSIYASAELAATHVNDQGGVLGGQRYNLPKDDSTCDNVLAASKAAQRLVDEERVIAIVGALCSGATITAATEVALPNEILMLSPGSTAPILSVVDDGDLLFRTVPSDTYEAGLLARLLIDKGINKIAISFADNNYGDGFATALRTAYEAIGGAVLTSQMHEFDSSDYSAHIESLAASGAITLVVLADADISGKAIVREALKNGHFANFAGGGLMAKNSLIDAVGINGVRYTAVPATKRNETKQA